MISKELLSEVLAIRLQVTDSDNPLIDNGFCYYKYADNSTMSFKSGGINIHELAHKCKEWAFDLHNEYELKSSILADCDIISCSGDTIKTFHDISEPEAIFKACEWIREQNDN